MAQRSDDRDSRRRLAFRDRMAEKFWTIVLSPFWLIGRLVLALSLWISPVRKPSRVSAPLSPPQGEDSPRV